MSAGPVVIESETAAEAVEDVTTEDVTTQDVLVEEVSIDGMCGVY